MIGEAQIRLLAIVIVDQLMVAIVMGVGDTIL